MFKPFLYGYYDVECQLPEYLKNMAKKYFEMEELEKSKISTIEEHTTRIDRIRKQFIDAIGGLPAEKTPLNAVCTGILKHPGYEIRKIVLESLPGFYVTANLYMPEGRKDKCPGILFGCGHSAIGKAAQTYQEVCIQLVRNGFVVLNAEPIGQGERIQYEDTKELHPSVWGTYEHSYSGLQCNLTGGNIARYFIWDMIRAMDYLVSLPEVDPERIGMTGNSGGGMQTAYMMLIDSRIKAAAPSCYINSRENYMKTGQAHDSEQNIFGSIANGINYDDFIAAFAPKPVLLNCAKYDFFCIEGALKSFNRAKRVYKLFNRENMVDICISESVHGYSATLRNAAVKFFIKHLKGEDIRMEAGSDLNMAIEDDKTLSCTLSGNVFKEYPGAKSICDLNIEYYNQNKYTYTNDIAILRQRIKEIMNFPQNLSENSEIFERVILKDITKIYGNETICEKLFFFSENDIIVAGEYLSRQPESKKCTILLLEDGTDSVEGEKDIITQLLDKGDVFVFDARGTGSVKSREVTTRGTKRVKNYIYGTEYKLNYDAFMMGTSLTALRVFDVLRARDYVLKRTGCVPDIAGKGIGAIYALIYAALAENVQNVYLKDMLPSFEGIIMKREYEYDCKLEIHGLLKKFDIPLILDVLKENNCRINYL